jgi:DNA-directed RNA polymerase alpha subunit
MSDPRRLPLTQPEYEERNRAIVAADRQGRTLRSIGDEFDLSPERVRQIVLRAQRETRRIVDTQVDWTPDTPIEALDLSVRARNVLRNEDMVTVADLLQRSAADLMWLPNFGRRTLAEVRAFLAAKGRKLREPEPCP